MRRHAFTARPAISMWIKDVPGRAYFRPEFSQPVFELATPRTDMELDAVASNETAKMRRCVMTDSSTQAISGR